MAAQGALVGASAALGCGTMGMAVYSNLATYLAQRERRHNRQDTPDCAAQIIATVGGISRQVLGSPALVRSAFTDPMEELRKARERNEKFATAEISVAGEALCSGYAAFNGEVIRTGPSFERAVPVVALGGAEVQRDGKTLTVQPKQTPTLLLQLPNEKEAENWHEWLKEATQRDDPVQRLHDVLTEAHDLEKHLTDMQNQMKRGHGHGHQAGGEFGHEVSPTSHESQGISKSERQIEATIQEMKQQLLLKESLESAYRQKLEYMELQLRQKEQENQYFKAQLDAVREEMKTAKEPQAGDAASLVEFKRLEEALSQERTNAVAQAKALAEAHVQLKRMQDRPTQDSIVRAQQDELMQLRGELRRIEEERNTARLGLANQALQLSALSDQQMELQSALNAAQGEIKRQKEQLEEMRLQSTTSASASRGATPRAGEKSSGSTTSKLSHSELQVLRTHMQSAVRRALEGAAAEQGLEYQQKLQELDEKLVELSPTRRRARQSGSGSRSGAVVREVEQKLAQLSPRGSPPGAKMANGGSLNFTAFGMEDASTLPNEVAPMRMSPLRRPSNMSSSEVILPQGLNSDGRVVAATSLSATHPGPPGSITLPPKLTAGRQFAAMAPSSWAPGRSLQAAPGVIHRAMEVMPAAQMAANAVAATSGWQPCGLHGQAFQTLPREHGYIRG